MKRTAVLSLMLVLALFLLACGAPPTQPAPAGEEPADETAAEEEAPAAAEEPAAEEEAAPPPTATPIVAEAGEGATKLIYWNGLTGSDGVTMVEMVEAFTKENPDVSVRVEMMPWDIYFDKLLTALVSGNPPDLFLLHEFEIPQFASKGVLGETAGFYTSGGGALPDDDFPDEMLNALEYEGKRYGVPIDRHGWGIWINRDLFEEAGLDPDTPPANVEEFVELARKLTLDANDKHPGEECFDPDDVVQWGTHVSWFRPTFLTTMWQFGGNWTDGEGNATINQEPAVKAVQFWHDLIYKEHVAPQPAGFDAWQSFAADQLAIIPEGSWMLNFNNDNEVNWGVWPMIQFGDQPVTWTSSHVIYTPSSLGGEKLEAAQRLVKYLTDHGLTWATSGQPPARLSEREALTLEEYPSTKVFSDSFARQGRYDTAHVAIQEIQAAYEPELDAAWNNTKSVEEALNDANKRIQSVLDRYK